MPVEWPPPQPTSRSETASRPASSLALSFRLCSSGTAATRKRFAWKATVGVELARAGERRRALPTGEAATATARGLGRRRRRDAPFPASQSRSARSVASLASVALSDRRSPRRDQASVAGEVGGADLRARAA